MPTLLTIIPPTDPVRQKPTEPPAASWPAALPVRTNLPARLPPVESPVTAGRAGPAGAFRPLATDA
eukprot:4838966-Heterocapsa_arctica.AAC.5